MEKSAESSTPVLVGCGEVTDLATPIEAARSPLDLIAEAGRRALADADASGLAEIIDVVAMLRLFSDSTHRFATQLGTSTNPPKSVACRLGITAGRYIYTSSGGNMPQYLVNLFSESIARGEMRAALIVGGEALRTQHGLGRLGVQASWSEDPGGQPESLGDTRRPWSDLEERHNARAAIVMYPLIENVIRQARGHSIDEHLRSMGRLMAPFSEVAARNPLATRREAYTPEQLSTVNEKNRWVGFPYPRLMNANPYIDQSAALVMTSVGEAQRLGIARNKWVFLHGCADGQDHYHVTQRAELGRSAAIRWGARKALDMAGTRLDNMTLLDLYSCFPSAIEIAAQEISLAEDDPRGLTITGGLPFFGGPGNNYVTHAIAEMMRRLRAKPGAFGMITANGNYVTKHSFGIYSTTPTAGPWSRESPAVLQAELDALPQAPLVEHASGRATIETYTVMHDKDGPQYGLLMGRLNESGARFIANTPTDRSVLLDLQDRESLGRSGTVSSVDGKNVFTPD